MLRQTAVTTGATGIVTKGPKHNWKNTST